MTRNSKVSLIVAATLVLAAVVAVALGGNSSEDEEPAGEARVLRPDTHLLSRGPEGSPTLVEFLDFECEGCGALYPVVEKLRERYAGRVTFAIRYFPNEGHFNAMNAAVAVEAAARQGRLEPMYQKMFEGQAAWGEADESKAALFARFAEELGLDMPRFRADVADPAVEARVLKDRADGIGLGVGGTPSLFLDGEPLRPESYEQLRAELDAALA